MGGHALTRKFRKIKQFGAFWCILYFNQTSMKFIMTDVQQENNKQY